MPLSLLFVFLMFLITVASAHSKIEQPEPESIYECAMIPGAPEPHNQCRGPCADFAGSPGYPVRNTPEKPAAVWARGQRPYVEWTRNNHYGGFIRFSLVPIQHKWSRKTHKYFAFEYGCWSSGLTKCTGTLKCGSDREGKMYSRRIFIPPCFPDGLYVLGVVWFGGQECKTATCAGGARHDYWSCSHVRIRGGLPLQKRCKAIFWPGDGQKMCDANVDDVDMPNFIENKWKLQKVPAPFRYGGRPTFEAPKHVRK